MFLVDFHSGGHRVGEVVGVGHVDASLVQPQMVVHCGSNGVRSCGSESAIAQRLGSSHIAFDVLPGVPVAEFQQEASLALQSSRLHRPVQKERDAMRWRRKDIWLDI
jgi:hypothetical protein